MSVLNHLHSNISTTFQKDPYRFFTEHDIHSELCRIATDFLERKGDLFATTKDRRMVSRIHHEYPTPFRCDMSNYDFKLITEEEFNMKRKQIKGFRARRGFIDFVILNAQFIPSNNLNVVSGKSYKDVLQTLSNQHDPVLDLAIEVVYHFAYDKKLHEGIMKRRVDSTIQDYKKLVELTKHKLSNNAKFCREAAMFFFSNTKHKDKLERLFESFPESNVPCFKIVHSNNR
jgi:hypothetical protein